MVAEPATLLDEARTHLRAAIGELRKLSEQVEQQLRRQNLSPRHDPTMLAAHQLAALQRTIAYELGRAYRNQAQCQAADSPDRANALTQAVKLLEPLAGLDPAEPVAWQSRIEAVVCRRLLADYATARRMLDAVLQQDPPPPLRLRVRAERIRVALAAGRLDEAITTGSQPRQIGATTSPELDYAWLETCLAASRTAAVAGKQAEAAQWQAQATDLAERIEQLHGPYWTRRTGMLLTRFVRATLGSGDLATLVRIAESAFRSGKLDDALVLYDDARRLAIKRGDAAKAFDLAYTAAAIEHERGRHEAALARYRQLAKAMPENARASTAHLMAIYHVGQIAGKRPHEPFDAYAALLAEHLRLWPDGSSADRARLQLGRIYEHRRDWRSAIATYRAISPGSAEHLKAVRAAARCCQAWLSELRAAGKPTEQIASEAAGWLESLLADRQGQLPERWSPVQRVAALEAARLRLSYTPAGYARAEQVLRAALEGATDAPAAWKSSVRAALVFSLAGQGEHRKAGEMLAQISEAEPGQLLAMLAGLSRVARDAPASVRTELAALRLRTIELLHAGDAPLDAADQRRLAKLHAKALSDAGRTDESLSAYGALAKEYPRDGAIQEEYVRLLLTRADRASLEEALVKGRQLEKGSPPQSPQWFRAKYTVALLHYRLGNKQQATKIITLLSLLHPELGGPELKTKFADLLARCRE